MTSKLMPRTLLFGALLAAGLAATAQAQIQKPSGDPLTSAQVQELLTAKGFKKVHDVKFEDGLWEADATSGDGKALDLKIEPVSGRIYGEQTASRLSEADIRAALTSNGYSKIHDLKFEGGLWEAKAQQSTGQDIKVHVDPNDGLVVSAQND
ncbi:MAG TPA: peptidase propeptide and ypeb domain-containing protein [Xanthomonadaceae bacterium]|nr:peptidase propeptide and ypeb domain-containing protein [Xanthomonadaceae bacterium]